MSINQQAASLQTALIEFVEGLSPRSAGSRLGGNWSIAIGAATFLTAFLGAYFAGASL